MKPIAISKESMKEIIDKLGDYGLREDHDFYVEPIFQIYAHLEATATVIVTEDQYEKHDYYFDHPEIQDVMHEEKTTVGHHLLDKDFKPTTFEKLIEGKTRPKFGKNKCGICGKPLIPRVLVGMPDRREMDGKLRCFDHIGVKVDG